MPCTAFLTMCMYIEADVTPAMDPTQSCSWQGEKTTPPLAATSSASSMSLASPSKTMAPVTAPRMSAHSIGGPACRMVFFVIPGTTSIAWPKPTRTGWASMMRRTTSSFATRIFSATAGSRSAARAAFTSGE